MGIPYGGLPPRRAVLQDNLKRAPWSNFFLPCWPCWRCWCSMPNIFKHGPCRWKITFIELIRSVSSGDFAKHRKAMAMKMRFASWFTMSYLPERNSISKVNNGRFAWVSTIWPLTHPYVWVVQIIPTFFYVHTDNLHSWKWTQDRLKMWYINQNRHRSSHF